MFSLRGTHHQQTRLHRYVSLGRHDQVRAPRVLQGVGERMIFKLVTCPYCDSNNWEQIGLVSGQGRESIQAKCNDCKGVFEMIVSERREYDNFKESK